MFCSFRNECLHQPESLTAGAFAEVWRAPVHTDICRQVSYTVYPYILWTCNWVGVPPLCCLLQALGMTEQPLWCGQWQGPKQQQVPEKSSRELWALVWTRAAHYLETPAWTIKGEQNIKPVWVFLLSQFILHWHYALIQHFQFNFLRCILQLFTIYIVRGHISMGIFRPFFCTSWLLTHSFRSNHHLNLISHYTW